MFQMIRTVCLALAMLALHPSANAQGHELVPWPARKAIPALSVADLDGKVWRLADLRGKAVLINFWASWCAPCQTEMPSLQTLAELYGPDKLVVLAVNFKESAPVVQRYRQRTGLALPVMLDPSGTLAREWGATVFPTTVLVAPDGRVRGTVRGELDWAGQPAGRLVDALLAPAGRATSPAGQ
jgi:thiol-disulfide isomerase/thioredoxin